jgi:hypothetical protein
MRVAGLSFERRTFSAQCSKAGVKQFLLTGSSSRRSCSSMNDPQMSLKLLLLASMPIDRYRLRTPATFWGVLTALQPAANTTEQQRAAVPRRETPKRFAAGARRGCAAACPAVLLASMVLILLSGCGSGGATSAAGSPAPAGAQGTPEPFTHQQQLIEQGARLIVSDGCAACHLAKTRQAVGPSFASFAGHDVTLADGRRVLVDERFLREALLHPRGSPLAGYDPAPMLAAVRRLRLSGQPEQVAALAAFIEEIGPESEPG